MKNPITIIAVRVDNFLRLKVARVKIDPDSGLIRITGQNKAGKTSLLRSIKANLGGGKEVPDDPLHEDSETGEVTLELSNGYTIERRFTNTDSGRKGYLKIVGPDGEEMKQTALNEWLGPLSFDPLHFFSLSLNEQRDILLRLDPEVADKLVQLDNKSEVLKSERLPYNSTIQKIQRMKAPDGMRPEKVDVLAEMRELGELEAQQVGHNEAAAELKAVSENVLSVETGIRDLQELIAVENDKLARGKGRLDDLKKEVAEHRPVTTDIDQLKEKISGADKINAELAPWETYDRGQEELLDARDFSESYTAKIADLEDKKKGLLEKLSVGVEGLGFDGAGNPTLNGHPMEQASGRERVEVAVQVAIAYDAELKVCLVDEGNDLDAEGLIALDALAKEHDFQIWLCRIDEGNPGEIIVDNGEAWTEGQK